MIRLLLLLALLFSAAGARADTALTLFKSVAGNVNFVGGQGSMRKHKNHDNDPGKACELQNDDHDIKIDLSGIPSGATVLSAQLYWAGSGSTGDYSVIMDNATVSAVVARRYTSLTIGGGFDYFSGAADVTAAVQAKGNAQYRFSGLTVNAGNPWCASSGVVGGFSLLVIYSKSTEPFRVLNLYEGFSHMRFNSLSLTLGNFQIPTPLGSATGRIGHITWEGDDDLSASGENLSFNGTQMTDGDNPSGNQFNSKSNIDGDDKSFGIDFDAYTVSSPVIQAGQTSATTVYQAGQDLVLLSAEIIAVPNVATADLEITMTRNAALLVGTNATYTLSVKNLGPSVETGPITVVNTLPAKLSYVSAAGTGWSCAASGQVVTCTRAGTLALNASASPITLTARPNASGAITNVAVVDGSTFDNIASNSTDSDTSSATGASANLAITKTLAGSLVVGANSVYTLTVQNLGPDTEPGPITVVDTLPAGLSYVAASGTGWVCNASGQTVTCTRAGTLGIATAPSIALTVSVTSSGSKSNVATVDGAAYDDVPGNSSATHVANASGPAVTGYVFTNKACAPNVAFGSGNQCIVKVWSDSVAGADVGAIFITAVNGNTPVSPGAADTQVAFQFALSCHNPTSSNGTVASFGTASARGNLPACAQTGSVPTSWSAAANLLFKAGEASADVERLLNYDDVGSVSFHMRPTGSPVSSGAAFTFHPSYLDFSNIATTATPAVPNKLATAPNGEVFARAGWPFAMTVGAYSLKNSPAKNFGREQVPETFKLTQEIGTIGAGIVMANPPLEGGFNAISNGTASGTNFSWPEVGSLKLTLDLGLASTIYSGVLNKSVVVGRFIPDHFDTVATGPLACVAGMACADLTTAAYSGQPFTVEVSARDRKIDAVTGNRVTKNYGGALAKAVTLSAWNAADGLAQHPSWPAVNADTFTGNAVAAADFTSGVSKKAGPVYLLNKVYAHATPVAWTAPTSIYIRAADSDMVSSKRAEGSSVEGGVRIVNGRLYVGNVHGSERLSLALPLSAQYWTGSNWIVSTSDTNVSLITKNGALAFSNCRGKVRDTDGSCKAAVAPAASQAASHLTNGRTTVLLQAPNLTGSVEAAMNNPVWLPSTVGRVHFGTYRSPLIYVREVF